MKVFSFFLLFLAGSAQATECKLGRDLQGNAVSENGKVRWSENNGLAILTNTFGQPLEAPLITDGFVGSPKYARSTCKFQELRVETFNKVPVSYLASFECPLEVPPATQMITLQYDYALREGIYKETDIASSAGSRGFRFSDCGSTE